MRCFNKEILNFKKGAHVIFHIYVGKTIHGVRAKVLSNAGGGKGGGGEGGGGGGGGGVTIADGS